MLTLVGIACAIFILIKYSFTLWTSPMLTLNTKKVLITTILAINTLLLSACSETTANVEEEKEKEFAIPVTVASIERGSISANFHTTATLESRTEADIITRVTGIIEQLDVEEGDYVGLSKSVSCGQDIAGDGCFSLGMLSAFEKPLTQYGAWFYPRLYWECGAIGQVLYLQAEVSGIRSTGIGCFFDDPVHDIFGIKDMSYQTLYHFTVGGPVEDRRLTTLPPY